jgi:Zn-dependent protease with chaperone function
MSATAPESVWLDWYKAQLPKSAKAAKDMSRALVTFIVCMLFLPVTVIGFLVATQFVSDSDGFGGLQLGGPSWALAAFIGLAALHAACDVGTIHILRLDRFVVRSVSLRVVLFLVVTGCIDWSLGGLAEKTGMVSTGDSEDPFGAFFFYVIVVILERTLLFVYLYVRYRAAKRSYEPSRLLPIARSSESQLWVLIDRILDRVRELGLPDFKLSVWLERTDGTEMPTLASVRAGKDVEYRLLVPRRFFERILPQTDRASAVLAHELGHAIQNDTELWSRNDLFYVVIARVFLPQFVIVGVIGVVVALLSLVSGNFNVAGLFPLSMSVMMYRSHKYVRNARQQSEFYADLFASYITSEEDIVEAIKLYATDDSPLHPSRPDRLENLAQKRAEINSGEIN